MDGRDRASSQRWWDSIDAVGETVRFDGRRIPIKFVVCPTCRGRSQYVNPAIDSHGLTQDDFDADPDFMDDYRSGRFNVRCEHCRGASVIPCPIRSDDLKRIMEWQDEEYDNLMTMEAERRMGA